MVSPARPRRVKRVPAVFNLRDFSHIGHGTSGVQIGQDNLLPGAAEHVRALRHKVHAAENNVFSIGFSRNLRKLVAVAGVVGKADDLVALVVVAQEHGGFSQLRASLGNALVHGVIGLGKVVFKAANTFGLRRGRRQFVNRKVHNTPPSVPFGTGMLKASMAAVNALTLSRHGLDADYGNVPSTGMLQPFLFTEAPFHLEFRSIPLPSIAHPSASL